MDAVLMDALRVGKQVIVGIPNFAQYEARLRLFFRGRAPVTTALPEEWFETQNIRFLSISDFIDYCRKRSVTIHRRIFLGRGKQIRLFPNLFADIGILLISR